MYLFCAAADEDEDVQRRGFVCLMMNIGPRCKRLLLNGSPAWKIPLLMVVFPIRVDAVHIISDKPSSLKLFPNLWNALKRRIRLRFRYYTGTCVLYRLGILTSSRNTGLLIYSCSLLKNRRDCRNLLPIEVLWDTYELSPDRYHGQTQFRVSRKMVSKSPSNQNCPQRKCKARGTHTAIAFHTSFGNASAPDQEDV